MVASAWPLAGSPYLDTCKQEAGRSGILGWKLKWYTATEAQTHILFRSSTQFLIKMCGVNNVRAQPLSLSLGDALSRLMDTLWRKHGAAFITLTSWLPSLSHLALMGDVAQCSCYHDGFCYLMRQQVYQKPLLSLFAFLNRNLVRRRRQSGGATFLTIGLCKRTVFSSELAIASFPPVGGRWIFMALTCGPWYCSIFNSIFRHRVTAELAPPFVKRFLFFSSFLEM